MISIAAALATLPLMGETLDSAALDAAFSRFMEERRLPGLAVGIVKDGEVVYARGFGRTTRGAGKPITTKSIFHMASVSKPFTATAAMQLVEDGKMELDAPLVTYLPYFRLAEDASKTITVRQVLTHTSGFPDVNDYEWDEPQTDEGAAERFVRSLASESMLFPPGEDSRYSNMAFDAMADVIAKASGKPFEEYVEARILAPLGMDSSSFILAETPEEHRTQGHSTGFSDRISPVPCPVYPYNRRHAPSSTLNASVDDMCRWMLANLARGELDGERILETASYDVMWSSGDDTPDIGLSWWLEPFDGRPCVTHSGADTGFNSHIILLPEDGIGAVAMSNTEGASLNAITAAALRAALGTPYELPGPRLAIELAHVLDAEGTAGAIERYFELKETEPERWEFTFPQLDEVCLRLIRQERADEAIELASLATDEYPFAAAAFSTLGEALTAAGDPANARAAFETALELDPNDPRARANL